MKTIAEKNKKCTMCGLCCRLFLINLNEDEYRSGEYITVFGNEVKFDNFTDVEECGSNLLEQTAGHCVYLENNKCSIHESRPQVCRDFFCKGIELEYKNMRDIINKARISSHK